MFGSHCTKSWASTQAVIALSSGEAEYYGLVKAASVGLGVRAMQNDMGISTNLHIYTDAEAARGIATRRGLGRTRHIEVHYLWVQERVAHKDFELHRVRGQANPADLCTKHLDRSKMHEHMFRFNFHYLPGRAIECPDLTATA